MVDLLRDIETQILKEVKNAEIHLRDLTGAGDHFEAIVISDDFEGSTSLQRQQRVMKAVEELLKGPLHALSLKTWTQEDWKKRNREKI